MSNKRLESDYIGLSVGIPSMEIDEKNKKNIIYSSSSYSTVTTSNKIGFADDNVKETELRLGLPGSKSPERKSGSEGVSSFLAGKVNFGSGVKRGFCDSIVPPSQKLSQEKKQAHNSSAAKSEVVGWPPIPSFRKNTMANNPGKESDDTRNNSGSGCLYVKVSMDGAPYLRKVDLRTYSNYVELFSGLEKMFSCFTIGQCGSDGAQGKDVLSGSKLMDLLHGSQHVLAYEDKDDDWMLVGDVPWEMFINSCKRLRIMKGSEAIGLAPRAMEKYKTGN
ncbi:hypothetical protein MKW94_001993 [Papaver nudicaule]|uniref:Auxin-responsive protein n=1 Tax=Papaver nudicaule TaxID=74823 RepID=A0AA41RZQ5_PAPNU|nr:hypothetical protein [Papaver nudicaule]